MRYTANEADNLRKKLGLYYQKDEEKKVIAYDPSENHFGEKDYTTMDTVSNMLKIAEKEPEYAVQATLNHATFQVKAGMSFEEGFQAFKDALKNVPPLKEDSGYEKAEQERRNNIKSLDTPQIISMLSGIIISDVDYRDDSGDMKYVLQHLKDYKYDENKDLNANMAAAFPEYTLQGTAKSYREHVQQTKRIYECLIPSEEKLQLALRAAISKEAVAEWAKADGIPEKIDVRHRYDPSLSPQIKNVTHAEERLQDLESRKNPTPVRVAEEPQKPVRVAEEPQRPVRAADTSKSGVSFMAKMKKITDKFIRRF